MTGDVSSNSAPCSLVIDSCGKLLRPLQGVDVLQQHTEKENGLRRFATASGFWSWRVDVSYGRIQQDLQGVFASTHSDRGHVHLLRQRVSHVTGLQVSRDVSHVLKRPIRYSS